MRKHEPANGNGASGAGSSAPPLRAGDRLTRAEFLRIWDQHPEIKFAELIGGIVYMPSPLSVAHGDTDVSVGGWMFYYAAFTPGVRPSANATTLMGEDAPQPDDHLRILPEFGGATKRAGKLLSGAPELIAEICVSSAAYDMHEKLDLYQQSGVQEYLAVLVKEQEIRWHRLGKKGYELLVPERKRVWKSVVFPGLWLDGKALLANDPAKVLATLDKGLRSPEHAAFVRKLARKKKK